MELSDELAADRQSQTAPLDRRVLIARQAEEGLEDPVEGFGGNTGPESETITDQESAPAFPVTRTRPPAGVYFTALETRLPKICWQRVASVTTTLSGESARASQSSWRARAIGANWRSISAIRAPIVNEPRQIGREPWTMPA